MDIDRAHNTKIAIRDVLQTVFRHKRKMSFVFAVVAGSIMIWTLMSTEIYQSEAKVIVRPGREYLPVDADARDFSGPKPEFIDVVKAEREVITSKHTAGRVVDKLGLELVLSSAHPSWSTRAKNLLGLNKKKRASKKESEKSPEQRALEARDRGMRKISDGMSVGADGSTISITYNSDDPEVAHTILETVVSEYLARHIEIFESKASPEFLKIRLGELAEELERTEEKLSAYREFNNVAGLDAEKAGLILSENQLETEISHTNALENSTREKLASLKSAIENRSEWVEIQRVTGTQDQVSDFLRQEKLKLELREKEMVALYNDSYRPLIDLREQIANVKKQISEQEERTPETTVGIDANYAALQAQIDNVESTLAGHTGLRKAKEKEIVGLRERLRTMAGLELTMSRLRRNVATSEQEYLEYRASLTHAEADAALNRAKLSNVVVAQEATRPVKPIKPQKTRNFALALFAGLMAAVFLGCFLDYTDDTFKSQTDVEAFLEIPVLATISEEEFRSCM